MSSRALAAALAPLILLAPLAAHAQAQEPRRVFGDTPLTNDNDNVNNDKTVDLTEDSDFGDGNDVLNNNGVITIGANRTAPITITLTSLETLRNLGLIDMRNGHTGDILHLSVDYRGEKGGRLGLDVGPNGADKLLVDSVAYGETLIVLGGLNAQNAALTGDTGPVLVEGGNGTKAGAFAIENPEIGFVRYGLTFDATARTYRLKGVAGQRAYEILKISEGVNQVWRRSADAWSAHVSNLRDTGGQEGAGVWTQAHSQWLDRDDVVAGTGRNVSIGYRQTTYGGQMGVDLINGAAGETNILLGVTGGFSGAQMRFSGLAGQDAKLRGANIGGYMALAYGGYFFNALAKVDHQSIKVRGDTVAAKLDGLSYGGQIEVGGRSDHDGLGYEQVFSLSYVNTKLDDMPVLTQRLDFDNATGFVAKAGVRATAENEIFGGALTFQIGAFVAHDFTVKNAVTLVAEKASERLSDDGGRTFGQASLGLNYRTSGGLITFVEANGDYGGGREGGGVRIGARYAF